MARTPLRELLRLGTPMVAVAFFHLGERLLKRLHEWIGLAMVVGAALHVAGNWRAMVATPRRPPRWVFAALARTRRASPRGRTTTRKTRELPRALTSEEAAPAVSRSLRD